MQLLTAGCADRARWPRRRPMMWHLHDTTSIRCALCHVHPLLWRSEVHEMSDLAALQHARP